MAERGVKFIRLPADRVAAAIQGPPPELQSPKCGLDWSLEVAVHAAAMHVSKE